MLVKAINLQNNNKVEALQWSGNRDELNTFLVGEMIQDFRDVLKLPLESDQEIHLNDWIVKYDTGVKLDYGNRNKVELYILNDASFSESFMVTAVSYNTMDSLKTGDYYKEIENTSKNSKTVKEILKIGSSLAKIDKVCECVDWIKFFKYAVEQNKK